MLPTLVALTALSFDRVLSNAFSSTGFFSLIGARGVGVEVGGAAPGLVADGDSGPVVLKAGEMRPDGGTVMDGARALPPMAPASAQRGGTSALSPATGSTQLTRMPRGAYSAARPFVMAVAADFVPA